MRDSSCTVSVCLLEVLGVRQRLHETRSLKESVLAVVSIAHDFTSCFHVVLCHKVYWAFPFRSEPESEAKAKEYEIQMSYMYVNAFGNSHDLCKIMTEGTLCHWQVINPCESSSLANGAD